MARLKANGLDIEYEVHGNPKNQPLLLIMGLGAQLITWDEGFVDELVKRGFYVIRYDNRDSGLSSKMESAGPADIAAAYAGNPQPAYSLDTPWACSMRSTSRRRTSSARRWAGSSRSLSRSITPTTPFR